MHAHCNLVKPNNEPRFVATCNEYTHLSEDCVCVYVRNVSMIIRVQYVRVELNKLQNDHSAGQNREKRS